MTTPSHRAILIHAVTVHLTASQLALVKQLARYDDHRFVEGAVLDAIRSHCIAFLATVRHVEEWEAKARFDVRMRPAGEEERCDLPVATKRVISVVTDIHVESQR